MHHSSLEPVVSTFDTTAGPTLVDRSFVRASRGSHIRRAVKKSLKPASNTPIHVEGAFEAVFLLGDLHALVRSGVVDSFVVPISLDPWYIDQFMSRLFPLE